MFLAYFLGTVSSVLGRPQSGWLEVLWPRACAGSEPQSPPCLGQICLWLHLLCELWAVAQAPGPPWLTCLPSAGAEPGMAVRPSLESLLAASSHMLQEVLDSPFVDPLKNLRLPRELNPNKKYSWMQRKEERVSRVGLGWRGGSWPWSRSSEWKLSLPLLSCCVVLGKSFPFLGLGYHLIPHQPGKTAAWEPGLPLPFAACLSCEPLDVNNNIP